MSWHCSLALVEAFSACGLVWLAVEWMMGK